GPCIAACTDVTGKSLFCLYDDVDSNGPFFLTSLAYTFEHGTCNSRAFMTEFGMCFASCPKKEQKAHSASYVFKIQWYKDNRGNGPSWAKVPITDPCVGSP
ncbi:hypothetical protein BG006_001231, partial [Podila minutissima]